MSKASDRERESARETLREFIAPGATVYTVLRNVSRSGMNRAIDCYVMQDSEPRWITRLVSKATGITFNEKREALSVGGAGMDMGFHVVYELSSALYSKGFGCIGEGPARRDTCPSNDHSNGDRDYTRHGARAGCKGTKAKPSVCFCHDDSVPFTADCSACGCRVADHWHRDGGYALRHRWL